MTITYQTKRYVPRNYGFRNEIESFQGMLGQDDELPLNIAERFQDAVREYEESDEYYHRQILEEMKARNRRKNTANNGPAMMHAPGRMKCDSSATENTEIGSYGNGLKDFMWRLFQSGEGYVADKHE